MSQGGISRRLIQFSNVLIGRVPGGLAQVNVLASMFFGGISGAAVADVSSIGTMLIPMMKEKGYDDDYSVGITVTSACQGVIIPPSHNMIIYAMAAGGVSVGRLFLGGLVPGIMIGVSLMVITLIIAIKRKYPKERKYSLKESLIISKNAFLGLITAIIIIGGVISGIFTATESAAIACVYAFIVTFFIYREIHIKRFKNILYSSLKTLAMVMSLIAAASAYGWLLAYLKVPAAATNRLLTISDNRVVLLLLINVLLLVLGTIMDMAPLILITTPILYPVVVTTLGMSPIQFGIMLILNLGIGLCTPPVGSALFWTGSSMGIRTLISAGILLFPVFQPLMIYFRCRKIVSTIPEEMEISFDKTGITTSTKEARSHVDYSDVKSVVRIFNLMIIYTRSKQSFILSDQVMEDKRSNLYSFIKANVNERVKG